MPQVKWQLKYNPEICANSVLNRRVPKRRLCTEQQARSRAFERIADKYIACIQNAQGQKAQFVNAQIRSFR